MRMHQTLMELEKRDATIESLRSDKKRLDAEVSQLKADARYEVKVKDLDIEKAKADLRKEMQKSLIESDLKRVKAEASLETYEKMDTKAERKHIQNMLEKAIEGLSKAKVQVVK